MRVMMLQGWVRVWLLACLVAVLGGGELGAQVAAQDAASQPVLCLETGGHTAICRWVGFTPNGKQMVSLGHDKVIRVWDVRDPTAPRLERSLRLQIGPGDDGMLYAGALSPDGRWLAVGGSPSRYGIRILDLSTGSIVAVLRGHSNVINSLAFSADGDWLASGSADKIVRVWAVGAGLRRGDREFSSTELTGHTDIVNDVAFVGTAAGNGTGPRQIVSVSHDRTGRLWVQSRTGRWEAGPVLQGHDKAILRVACSPDGRWIATAAKDRTVRLWQPDGKLAKVLGPKPGTFPVMSSIAFAPDSQSLVAADDKDGGGAVVWSVPEGRELARYDGHDNTVNRAAFAPARSTDASSGGADGPGARPTQSSSPKRWIASTGGDANDICLWDAESGKELSRIVGRGGSVFGLAFSLDGARLAYGQVNQGLAIRGASPLTASFDLARMEPGPPVESSTGWIRGRLTADGLSATQPEDAGNTLVIRREQTELTRIARRESYDWMRCFSFLPGRQQIIVGSDFHLTWHDATTGKLLRTFVGHTGPIWAVAVSPDGRFLASGSGDQTIRLWSLERKPEAKDADETAPLLTFFPTKDGQEWVVWTEEGYYKASANGDQLIGWHLNQGLDKPATFLQAWQLRNQYHWPELIALVPGAGGVKQAVEQYNRDPRHQRRQVVDLQTNAERLLPPEIQVLEPQPQTSVTTRTTRLQAQVKLPKTVAQDLSVFCRVMVNDRPAPGWDQRRLEKNAAGIWLPGAIGNGPPGTRNIVRPNANSGEPPASDKLSIDLDVALVPGENVVSVVAWTDLSTSQPAKVRVTSTATNTSTHGKPDLYVLAVGVSDYADPGIRDLEYADDDAEGLVKVFRQQQGGLYGKVSVYTLKPDDPKSLLTNERATRVNILKGIKWLRQNVTQVDVAVVCVSGHGLNDGFGSYYFVPHDCDPNDVESTAIRWSEFNDTLSRIPCPVILVMDTCHAAGVTGRDRSLQERSDETQAWSNFIGEVTKIKSGLYVFSAALPQQRALEDSRWGHGALALSLMEGLGGERLFHGSVETPLPCDTNGNHIIELPELRTYVVRRVKELTKGYQHAEAQPKELPPLSLSTLKK